MNKLVKSIGAALLAIGLGIGIYYGNKYSVSPEQRLAKAELVVKEIPDIKAKLPEIGDYILMPGKLDGDTLAQTRVNIEGPAEILVDLDKVAKVHDRLEPVIGHELYHIWEAKQIYGGPAKFLELVKSEKAKTDWHNRVYEQSAIKRENDLRLYLISTYPKEYSSMAKSRDLQNNRKF